MFYRLVSLRGFFEESRRRQPHSTSHWVLTMLDPKITGSLIARLGTFQFTKPLSRKETVILKTFTNLPGSLVNTHDRVVFEGIYRFKFSSITEKTTSTTFLCWFCKSFRTDIILKTNKLLLLLYDRSSWQVKDCLKSAK